MKNNYNTYQQDELDALLISKEYSKLNESEKDLLKEHISSEKEYEMMRNTLINVKNSFSREEELIPDENIKSDLMTRFSTLHSNKSNGFWANLKNSLLPEGKNFLLTPAFQLSSLAILVVGLSIYFINNSENQSTIALKENDNKKENLIPVKPDENTISGKSSGDPNKPIDSRAALEEDPSIATTESIVISHDEVASDLKDDKSTFADIAINLEELKKSEEKKNNSKLVTEPGVDNLVVAEKSPSPIVSNGSGVTTTFSDASKLTTDTDKKKEKEEIHSAYSKMEKENANKDLPNSGISLGTQPELLEFLFTAL